MTNTILFTEENNGYSKEQVDSYISKLSKAYQAAYTDNQEIQEKYNALVEECKKLEVQEKTKLNADVITKTMLNLETLAQKIIAEAQEEVVRAKVEAQAIVDEANGEAARVKVNAQMIINEANEEKARAKSAAQRIRDDANTEAAGIMTRARRNAEQANETMKQALSRMQGLLTFDDHGGDAA